MLLAMNEHIKKTGTGLAGYIERVLPELGATNSKRLSEFMHLKSEDDGVYLFSTVFHELFPGQEQAKAQETFKKFRKSVNAVSYTHLTLPTTPYV